MRGAVWPVVKCRLPCASNVRCRLKWSLPHSTSNFRLAYDNVSLRSFVRHGSTIKDDQQTAYPSYELQRNAEVERILNRAPHGINSLQRLDYEADVGHLHDRGQKLIDLPVNRQDLDLWLVLLEYRILKDKDDGLLDILLGMRNRGSAVKLIDYDEASERIWDLALSGATRNDSILQIISDPSTSIGRDRSTLFSDIVLALLRAKEIHRAADAAILMRASHFGGYRDACAIADLMLDDEFGLSIDDLCHIHLRLPFTALYAYIIPSLWRQGNAVNAFKMHAYLLRHADVPKHFDQVEPFIKYLAQEGKPISSFIAELEKHGIGFTTQARAYYAQIKAHKSGLPVEVIDRMTTADTGIRHRKLRDQFVAKIFATHALSFELALKTVKFFGLVEIGPLAVREMATSSNSCRELRKRFRLLQQLEIDTGSSAFVATVKSLCEQNANALLRTVLECDQHHDVFEDQEMQKRLLVGYHARADWTQVNRTLAILNRGEVGVEASRKAQYLLLEGAIAHGNPTNISNQMTNMMRQGMAKGLRKSPNVALFTIDGMIKSFFEQKSQKSPSDEQRRQISHLIGLLQDMELIGIGVETMHWRQILHHLIQTQSIDQFQMLVWWIASRQRPTAASNGQISATTDGSRVENNLERIFTLHLQASYIRRCIYMRPSSKEYKSGAERIQRGPMLLRVLQRKVGFVIDRTQIRTEYLRQGKRIWADDGSLRRDGKVFDAAWSDSAGNYLTTVKSENVFREMQPNREYLQLSRGSNSI